MLEPVALKLCNFSQSLHTPIKTGIRWSSVLNHIVIILDKCVRICMVYGSCIRSWKRDFEKRIMCKIRLRFCCQLLSYVIHSFVELTYLAVLCAIIRVRIVCLPACPSYGIDMNEVYCILNCSLTCIRSGVKVCGFTRNTQKAGGVLIPRRRADILKKTDTIKKTAGVSAYTY